MLSNIGDKLGNWGRVIAETACNIGKSFKSDESGNFVNPRTKEAKERSATQQPAEQDDPESKKASFGQRFSNFGIKQFAFLNDNGLDKLARQQGNGLTVDNCLTEGDYKITPGSVMAGILSGPWKLIKTIAGFIANHKAAFAFAFIAALIVGASGPIGLVAVAVAALIGEGASKLFYAAKGKIENLMGLNINKEDQQPTESDLMDTEKLNREIPSGQEPTKAALMEELAQLRKENDELNELMAKTFGIENKTETLQKKTQNPLNQNTSVNPTGQEATNLDQVKDEINLLKHVNGELRKQKVAIERQAEKFKRDHPEKTE